jgi:hypothetical protein
MPRDENDLDEGFDALCTDHYGSVRFNDTFRSEFGVPGRTITRWRAKGCPKYVSRMLRAIWRVSQREWVGVDWIKGRPPADIDRERALLVFNGSIHHIDTGAPMTDGHYPVKHGQGIIANGDRVSHYALIGAPR